MWKHFITFTNKEELIHAIGYEELPMVSSVRHNFEELVHDEEFGMDKCKVDALVVNIISVDEFTQKYPEIQILDQ